MGEESAEYRAFIQQPSANMDDSGFFSVQVKYPQALPVQTESIQTINLREIKMKWPSHNIWRIFLNNMSAEKSSGQHQQTPSPLR